LAVARSLRRVVAARLGRRALIAAGTVSLGIGLAGVFLPILPTTPFLLLAAACYARSSDRLYIWLVGNRWFGSQVRAYREGRGVSPRTKALAVLLLWVTIGCSAAFVVSALALRALLATIAVGVTVFILAHNPRRPARGGSS